MAVLRLDRFTTGPADSQELLSRHAALVAAVTDSFPGLLGVELGDRTWIDVWRWDPWPARRRPSTARRPFPWRGAAISLTKRITVEYAEVTDA